MITNIQRFQKWERRHARERLQRLSIRQGLAVFEDLYRASVNHLTDSTSHAAVRTSFEAAVEDPGKFVSETNVIPLLDKRTKFRRDLIFSFTPNEREAIAGSESVEVAKGRWTNVVSAEDLVVYKMLAASLDRQDLPDDLDEVRNS